MYNKLLDAFVSVADCGSLTKASEALYLSPTAIMKQINQLEKHLELKLFIRTNKGIHLTEAGKSIYSDSLYMIQYSKEARERALKATTNHAYNIRVGTSLMTPAQKISALLQDVLSQNPHFQFQIVPFHSFREEFTQIVNHLGEQIDIIAGVYGFSDWSTHFHHVFPLFQEPVCIAVSQTHRLAERDCIDISDLSGETLFITEPGDSNVLDNIREELTQNYPDIRLLNTKVFDILIFNQCAATDNVLLTTPMWADLHPTLKPIKVNWEYSVPFGIFYSQHPDVGVQKFIEYLNSINYQYLI